MDTVKGRAHRKGNTLQLDWIHRESSSEANLADEYLLIPKENGALLLVPRVKNNLYTDLGTQLQPGEKLNADVERIDQSFTPLENELTDD